MSDTFSTLTDLTVIEWLIAFAAVGALGLVGAWVGGRSRDTYQAKQAPTTAPDETEHWHSLSVDETLERVESDRDGLSDEEAQRRLARYGPNSLPETKPRGPLLRLGHLTGRSDS